LGFPYSGISQFLKHNLSNFSSSDIALGDPLFTTAGLMGVPEKTLLASVGLNSAQKHPKIAIISTGDELVDSDQIIQEGQIFDSNSKMLRLLCEKYGFPVKFMRIARDDYENLSAIVSDVIDEDCDVIVSSGGVSMGDKDFIKKMLTDLGFTIHFGRVNMKPGKPMTFATLEKKISFFALPGNPVSAFVTFHLFVLPALRFMSGFCEEKCSLPTITVFLQDAKYELDERPEFVRATVTMSKKNGQLNATITANQISSRIASLINADVLVHLPARGKSKVPIIVKGSKLQASVIDQFFISGFSE
jgi:gephyrin